MAPILAVFLVGYIPVILTVGLTWVDWTNINSIMFFLIWDAVMAKILYELAQMAVAVILPAQNPPCLPRLQTYPRVAILYVCRDDVVLSCLQHLKDQTYPNCDVFILDDSDQPEFRALIDRYSYTVVRRMTRVGFKAGNINHWLVHFGAAYEYFVIFDSDSLALPSFVEEMVRYAEHPSNWDIAIFQSQILSWNTEASFPRLMGASALFHMMILKKVGNRSASVISFGHNNLHRTDAIRQIGGFDEELTSEDTAATLALSAKGFRCALVNIVSYDSEPSDILKHRRRATRWAAQTAALFHRPWRGASASLKFEVCRQFGNYVLNSLFIVWLAAEMWDVQPTLQPTLTFVQAAIKNHSVLSSQFLSLVGTISIIVAHLMMRSWLSIQSGVRLHDYLGHLLLSHSAALFTWPSVTKGLIAGLLGRTIAFVPSNADNSSHVSLVTVLQGMKFVWLYVVICGLRYWFVGHGPWMDFGRLWTVLALVAPLIIGLSHIHPKGVSHVTPAQ